MQTGPNTWQRRATIHESNGTCTDGWVRVRKDGMPSKDYLVRVLRDGETEWRHHPRHNVEIVE